LRARRGARRTVVVDGIAEAEHAEDDPKQRCAAGVLAVDEALLDSTDGGRGRWALTAVCQHEVR